MKTLLAFLLGSYLGFYAGGMAMLRLCLKKVVKGEFPPSPLPERMKKIIEEEVST